MYLAALTESLAKAKLTGSTPLHTKLLAIVLIPTPLSLTETLTLSRLSLFMASHTLTNLLSSTGSILIACALPVKRMPAVRIVLIINPRSV